MAFSMLSHAANALITPLPVRPVLITQGKLMELTYPLMDSRVTSLSVRQTVNITIGLLIGMTSAKEYTKMLDPLQYDPYLMQEVISLASVPPSSCEQHWNNLTLEGKEPGKVVVRKKIPLYLLQARIPLYGLNLWNAPDFIHSSQRLAHPVTIPQNYTGLDIEILDSNILFATWTHTWVDGFSYWNEPLASVYEGLGYAFPMQQYHDTMQIPVHHQGFEILHHNYFAFTTRFCELVNHQNPNEFWDYIINPTNLDPLEGDVIRHCCLSRQR